MMVLPWTLDSGFWPGEWGGKAGTCAFVGCRILSTIVFIKLLLYWEKHFDRNTTILATCINNAHSQVPT